MELIKASTNGLQIQNIICLPVRTLHYATSRSTVKCLVTLQAIISYILNIAKFYFSILDFFDFFFFD